MMTNKTTETPITPIQYPDNRLMERIRSLERNERVRLHIAQMKCDGYSDDECKTWLIKIAMLSDFMDVSTKFLLTNAEFCGIMCINIIKYKR